MNFLLALRRESLGPHFCWLLFNILNTGIVTSRLTDTPGELSLFLEIIKAPFLLKVLFSQNLLKTLIAYSKKHGGIEETSNMPLGCLYSYTRLECKIVFGFLMCLIYQMLLTVNSHTRYVWHIWVALSQENIQFNKIWLWLFSSLITVRAQSSFHYQ